MVTNPVALEIHAGRYGVDLTCEVQMEGVLGNGMPQF